MSRISLQAILPNSTEKMGKNGAHVIMLGPGNEDAAQEALKTWPRALQIGGGINEHNAMQWIQTGAEKVALCLRVCDHLWS